MAQPLRPAERVGLWSCAKATKHSRFPVPGIGKINHKELDEEIHP
ncbi:uncharacterized protein RSE6_09036 [Rhynchosporium secalis]|nr:uncharacterized protein RSE6_09036 [Rhynchosporium secalis]